MLWTLYRYILRELLKVLLLSSAVLVTVIAFATAVKPISDGLLGPASLIRFVLYTIPTVLGFALPFAGAFASTLVFIRLANDNEVLACSASGISYGKLLAPVFGLGMALTITLAYLSNFVVPWFYQQVAQTVQGDVVTLLVNRLNNNESFEFREQQIVLYADDAVQLDITPVKTNSGLILQREIALKGVAVGKIGQEDEMRSDATAQEARVQLFVEPSSGVTYARVGLIEPLVFDEATGRLRQNLGQSKRLDVRPIRLPNPIDDNPKFLSWFDLQELTEQPGRFDEIREEMGRVADALAEAKLMSLLTEALTGADSASRGEVWLDGPLPGERYRITAPRINETGGRLALRARSNQPVVVEKVIRERGVDTTVRQFMARVGILQVEAGPLAGEPGIRLQLREVRIIDPGSDGPGNESPLQDLDTMIWPGELFGDADAADDPSVTANIQEFTVPQLIAEADKPYANTVTVQNRLQDLQKRLGSLHFDIIALRHERIASAVASMLLLVIGAVLSIRLKGNAPLAVFFWSFLLAILTVLIINSGQNIAGSTSYDSPAPGLLLLWAGNVMLAGVIGWQYCVIAKH